MSNFKSQILSQKDWPSPHYFKMLQYRMNTILIVNITRYGKSWIKHKISVLNIKMFIKIPLIIVQEIQCSTHLYVWSCVKLKVIKNNYLSDFKTNGWWNFHYLQNGKTINYDKPFYILRKFVFHLTKYKNQCWHNPLLYFLIFVYNNNKKKRSPSVTKSLNYRGDLDAVSLSDSVHVLCFSNEKLCCTQKKKKQQEN